MIEDRRNMQRYAMLLGTYMGGFWIFKFIFFPLGMKYPFLSLLFMVLTCGVPFIGYYYAKIYRNRVCGGSIGFSHAWLFTMMLYIFAAILAAVAHYIYFRYIDHGFILSQCELQLDLLGSTNIPEMGSYLQTLRESLEIVQGMSPIDITMQLLSQNIFMGSILALPTALFVKKNKSAHVG